MDNLKKDKKHKRRGLGRGLSSLISFKEVPLEPNIKRDLSVDEESSSETVKTLNKEMGVDASNQINANTVLSKDKAKDIASLERDKPYLFVENNSQEEQITYLPSHCLEPNPNQPRENFNQEQIDELAKSIKEHGLLQPILARPLKEKIGYYQIVAGERRYRAICSLNLEYVPVIIKEIDDLTLITISIIENVQREDLSPIEEAKAYQRLIDEFSLTQKEVAEQVGKSRSGVANLIRLLTLPKEIQEMVDKGRLSLGHAKVILSVKEPAVQRNLANKVVKEDLTVRELEDLVSRKIKINKKKNKSNIPASNLESALSSLRMALGTKVNIVEKKKGRGKIIIEYYSEDELERIVEKITI